MTALRLLYGLDRLPRTLAADDPRLPAVTLGPAPLRLHSVPLPADAWGSDSADQANRMAAVRSWLLAQCGDYNERLRRQIACYLDAVSAHVAAHRTALAAGLAAFDGLYRVEDWCWSALRPLPRAWWQAEDGWVHAELAFWDGRAVITMADGAGKTELEGVWGDFWRDEVVPVSPFRRPFPAWPAERGGSLNPGG